MIPTRRPAPSDIRYSFIDDLSSLFDLGSAALGSEVQNDGVGVGRRVRPDYVDALMTGEFLRDRDDLLEPLLIARNSVRPRPLPDHGRDRALELDLVGGSRRLLVFIKSHAIRPLGSAAPRSGGGREAAKRRDETASIGPAAPGRPT